MEKKNHQPNVINLITSELSTKVKLYSKLPHCKKHVIGYVVSELRNLIKPPIISQKNSFEVALHKE